MQNGGFSVKSNPNIGVEENSEARCKTDQKETKNFPIETVNGLESLWELRKIADVPVSKIAGGIVVSLWISCPIMELMLIEK